MASSDSRLSSTATSRHLLPLVLADDLSEGLVVIDRESVIQYANPAMTRIFAYGRDELEGESLTILMPESHRERHREALEGYLSTGRRHLAWSDVELPGRHRDGHRLDLRISFTEFSRHGRRLFAGTIRDVTARRDPEERQRLLARSYRALFDRDVAAVFRIAPDGRILAVNGALARMAGFEAPDELEGEDVATFYVDDRDLELFLRDLQEHREVRNRELRLRRADGTVQWSLVNAVWIDDPTEQGPEALVGTVVDISGRKRVERDLELSRERYQRLFEQKLFGVFRSEAGPGGEILACNEAFADLFGYASPAEVVGTPGQAFFPEDEDRQAVVDEIREEGVGVVDQARLRRKDGSVVWGLAYVRAAEDLELGEILEGAIFDITDRVRAREELERATEKFRGVFDISPVALKILRPGTDEYVDVNEHFETVFGHDREQVLDGTVTSDDLWEDPGERRQIYERLHRGGRVRDVEVRLRRKDGIIFDALFSAAWLELAEERLLVSAVQDITELKEVERELEHRSLHDRLTGLPNRALFWDRLEHALQRCRRTGLRVAVLFLDLDGFKRINDEHGHGAGDEALRQVADRFRTAVREVDTLARLGGDEFGILLEDLADDAEADEVADRITDLFGPPISVAGEDALVRVSCGIALTGGDGAEETASPDELVHRADRAMYVAKVEPGSSARRYGPEIAEERTGRLRREVELQEAIANGDVVPFYQPIVDLEDGSIVGAEALARWVHPERGTVAPGAFIPLAEETGLIVELGRLVVRSACAQLADWRDGDLLPPGFQLHVNLSARELDRPDVADVLSDLFTEQDVDPASVSFEVTESVAVESAAVLDEIRALGPAMAVDDFGTGYATLERVADLDLDTLKIDRLFVSRIGESSRHEAVLAASLTLAASMDLWPVAEGVETEEQRAWLLERDCRHAQGFLFAPAVSAEELTVWLRSGRRLPT
jgi:diguanylate cyclase (GGDEF)-like protein/PAS domain S-box-containing protein